MAGTFERSSRSTAPMRRRSTPPRNPCEDDAIFLAAEFERGYCCLPSLAGQRVRNVSRGFPQTAGERKKDLRHDSRKSLRCQVPETGIEPALPLRKLGPQPSASASSATPACSDVLSKLTWRESRLGGENAGKRATIRWGQSHRSSASGELIRAESAVRG